MSDETLLKQAADLEALLPRLARRLFTLEPTHPVSDLPLGQLRLCSALQVEPRTVSSLSEELRISPSAVTQIADRLERLGLVERSSDSPDRRYKHLKLTPRGEEWMRSRRETRVRNAADAMSHLSEKEREQVLEALRLLLAAARQDTTPVSDDAPLGRVLER